MAIQLPLIFMRIKFYHLSGEFMAINTATPSVQILNGILPSTYLFRGSNPRPLVDNNLIGTVTLTSLERGSKPPLLEIVSGAEMATRRAESAAMSRQLRDLSNRPFIEILYRDLARDLF